MDQAQPGPLKTWPGTLKTCFLVESKFLAIHLNFWRLGLDRSRRVSMTFLSFSLDGKKVCQFMTPNLPQPYVFGPFPPGVAGVATGTMYFFSFQEWHLAQMLNLD